VNVRAAASLCLAAWAGLAVAQRADDVVAKLGGMEMHASDVRRLVQLQDGVVREQVLRTPGALDRLIRAEMLKRALAGEARAKGFDKLPEVAEQMERAREQALVQSYVASLSRPAADFPQEAEVRKAYEANRAEFARPRQWHVAQIYVASADGEKKAADLAKRARASGGDFAALARASSEHAESAQRGGDIGWVGEGQVLPEVARALAKLKPGEVSDPVRSSQGWHVLKLLEERPASQRSLEEVHDALSTALRTQRARDNEQRYLDELLSKTPLAVNEVALQGLRDDLLKSR